jgi:hypothetical protein
MATRRLLLLSATPHAVLAQLPPAEFAALFLFSSISAMPGDLTGNRIKHHRRDKRNSPGWEKQEALEVGMAAYCTCMGRRPDAQNLSERDRHPHPPETWRGLADDRRTQRCCLLPGGGGEPRKGSGKRSTCRQGPSLASLPFHIERRKASNHASTLEYLFSCGVRPEQTYD